VSRDWDGTFLRIGARHLRRSERLPIGLHLFLSTCRDRSGRVPGVAARTADSGFDARLACRDQRDHRSLDLPSRRFRASASLRSWPAQTRAGSAADPGLRCGEPAFRRAQSIAAMQSRTCARVRGGEDLWAMGRGVRDRRLKWTQARASQNRTGSACRRPR
jgi:hypothetical protein